MQANAVSKKSKYHFTGWSALRQPHSLKLLKWQSSKSIFMSSSKRHSSIYHTFRTVHYITKLSKRMHLWTFDIRLLSSHSFHSSFFFSINIINLIKWYPFLCQSIPPTTNNLRKFIRLCLTIWIFLWLNLFRLNFVFFFFNWDFLSIANCAVSESYCTRWWFLVLKWWNYMLRVWVAILIWLFINI